MRPARFPLDAQHSASNKMPRQINRNLIFNQIRVRQPISRADLARSSGLQRSTVSLIVEELLAERWIVEGSMGRLPRGRRPTFLNLNSQRGVLAIDVHPDQATLAITDLGGELLDQRIVRLPHAPVEVLPALLESISSLRCAHPAHSLEGVGISVPGRVDPNDPSHIFAPNIAWPIADLHRAVSEATGLPVVLDNVANACALSEVWFGASSTELVVVNVSEGVGTGIYTNGHLLRGAAGAAGEFGHVQLDPNGLACGCGSRGCWETVASNRAGLRAYAAASGKTLPDFSALLQLVRQSDAHAVAALETMGAALGRGLRMIATTLAPEEIVVVGDLTAAWEQLLPAMSTPLTAPGLVRTPRLRPAEPVDRARVRGSVALILNESLL